MVWECVLLNRSDAHLRQRGCGYVHVTPRRHRQQWRNVWPGPVALGTISRGRAPPSSRILPPRGLVRQMAVRRRDHLVTLAWHGVLNAHFVSIMTRCKTSQKLNTLYSKSKMSPFWLYIPFLEEWWVNETITCVVSCRWFALLLHPLPQ